MQEDKKKARLAGPQRLKKAEAECEPGSGFPHLSRSLDLPITLADFFSTLAEEKTERSHRYANLRSW